MEYNVLLIDIVSKCMLITLKEEFINVTHNYKK